MADAREPLLEDDHNSDAAEELQAEEFEEGDEGLQPRVPPPPRSPLSRVASLSAIAPVPRGYFAKRHSTFEYKAAGWFVGTLLFGVLAVAGIVFLVIGSPPAGAAPTARMGASIAVLPVYTEVNASQRLVVWGGQGQSGYLFRDLHTFGLDENGAWKKVKSRERCPDPPSPPPAQHAAGAARRLLGWWPQRPRPCPSPPRPEARWKAAAAQLGDWGMAMHGGISHTHNASGYRNDTWALAFPGLRWLGPANYSGGEAGAAFPSARRAHSLASYLDEDGSRFLLLFGGRRSDGLLLNDVWQGRLEEGKGGSLRVAWTLLHDPQTSTGTGPAPLPRSGHVAVMNGSSSLILHGGRSEVYGSFADVWSFDLASKRWTPLPPATAVQPAARDFHGGALWNGRLFIYGGRFGTPGGLASHPIGDRFVFDLQARTWRQLPIRGMSPLPRWMFASTQFAPTGGGAETFLLFGGQTGAGCNLNDVWRLSLDTYLWTQLSEPRFATKECQHLFS